MPKAAPKSRIMEQSKLKLYNFLSRKVEEFKPLEDQDIGLYTCGPTVYDFVHIGNWRTFVFEDILKRVLTSNGYQVKHVMNITDIDDKIIHRSKFVRQAVRFLARRYEEAFFEDLVKLNILKADEYPRATDHIASMIQIIEVLLDKGIAYKGEDGIYFSVEKFGDYGKLSNLKKRTLKKGARINDDQYDKENWADFALWKFPQPRSSPGLEPSWPAPFGQGRPGWHIECSAMSMEYLGKDGKTIDIHCGGVDLLFPHHENEIAQSEAATDRKFVNFWCEGEHLLVENQKMAKSASNIFTLSDLAKRGVEPLSLRYLFLTAHYRSKLNFTWESLKSAQNALNNLREEVENWDKPNIGCAGYEKDFVEAINSDLDMPKALAIMRQMVKSDYPSSAKHASILVMDKILGLNLDKIKKSELPKSAKVLIEKREELRKQGKFDKSDKLRKELLNMGVEIEDTKSGPRWKVRLESKSK